MRGEQSIVIPAPIDKVYAYVSDFERHIMFSIMSRIMGINGYTEAEITTMIPNERIEWNADTPGRNSDMMKAEWEIRFEDADHSTEVLQRFHFMPQYLMTERATSESMQQDIADEVGRNLEKLKAILAA